MADRSLHVIAQEIESNWPKIYFGARPYLDAMHDLDKITDAYGSDSAKSIVRYFLSNARTWHGPVARQVKTELNAMLA